VVLRASIIADVEIFDRDSEPAILRSSSGRYDPVVYEGGQVGLN